MPEQELLVRIVGDDRSLQQAFTRSSRSAQQFETKTSSVGSSLSKGLGAAGLTLGLGAGLRVANSMAQAASDLNEEITKSEKIFGDSSQAIQEWAGTTANSIGISKEAALAATGTFGNLFSTVGLGQKPAADMSKALTTLGADLASFNNANIDDVLQAIRSGLIGEAEPLRRYGVLLSETRVQQVAMADSGKTNVRALTNQEKALARYKIILEDTVPAQGDFADTADGAANAQRRAAASAADLSANLGSILVPALQGGSLAFVAFADGANTGIDGIRRFHDALKQTDAFDGWNKGVEDANSGILGFFRSIGDNIPLLDEAIDKGRELRGITQGVFGEPGKSIEEQLATPSRDRGVDSAGAVSRAAAIAAANAKDAAAAIDRATRRANATLEQKIQDSASRIAHLKKLIGEDPANVKLAQRLTGEIKAQNTLIEQQTALNKSNARAAESAAKSAHDASVRAAADRREAAQAAAEARRARIAGRQFEAIGLTSTGQERVPGIGALRRRARSLLEQISGTGLDTGRNRDRIGAVLSQQFKDAGREVREAILSMFNEISAALDQGAEKTRKGPLTKFRVANTSTILAGLGLSEEETQQLRRRLSRLGANGTSPRPGGAGGAFGLDVGGGGNVIVNGDVIVRANDAREFAREMERKTRRSTNSRTGPRAGAKLGGV